MKQATRQTAAEGNVGNHLNKRLREGGLIMAFALAIFLFIALLTHHYADPAWSHTGGDLNTHNAGGRMGAWLADVFLYCFGYMAYLFPVIVVYLGLLALREKQKLNVYDIRQVVIHLMGFFLLFVASCGLASLQFPKLPSEVPFSSGGLLGHVIGLNLAAEFNVFGSTLLLSALLLTGITLFTGLSWMRFTENVGKFIVMTFGILWNSSHSIQSFFHDLQERRVAKQEEKQESKRLKALIKFEKEPKRKSPKIKTVSTKVEMGERFEKERQAPLFDMSVEGDLPPLALLDIPKRKGEKGFSKLILEELSRQVEAKLLDFGFDVQVVAVHPGPVIRRFELQLSPGMKASRITALSKDLARSLSVHSVRIVEVIPGKSVIGLEIPNTNREVVSLSEVLASKTYEQARSVLSLALGKDIAGHPVIVDLGKMPHLLVAGTTGSGKSVGLNAMILSLLYKSAPNDVRLILVDPKMLELAVYDGIPHLLTPVVTDMKDAANALRWCVAEMERRYKVMASMGVRNIAGYNSKVDEGIKAGKPLKDPFWESTDEPAPNLERLPMIVVVIDEFADLMMAVGKKVEELIARIAQKARAAGIHLILATQRPSVDVITGLIKANIPTRIAYQVSSRFDSRTILDQQGAEQLLGEGDMLYMPSGTSIPVRVHGAYVADHEVHKVVKDWKKRSKPSYLAEIVNTTADVLPGEMNLNSEDSDALYDEAVAIVTQSRRASISSIQRRLKIGFNRAARLVETMEAAGVVSGMDSSGNREVLAPPPPEV